MRTINLIGIPLDDNASFMQGAAQGPEAALAALHSGSANLWSETGHDLASVLVDAGVVELPGMPAAMETIAQVAREAGESEDKPIFIGGDHSITYPLVKGLRQAVGKFTILHFDAHPDCYDSFEGNPFSHASPFSRIMEESLCTRLVSVGIRTATGHQREQKARFGIEWLEMKDFASWPRLVFDGPVYISLDMDVLDPAHAPGVAHHEPGGLTARQVLDIIHGVDAPIIGADIVELNPGRDVNTVTAMVAAKLIREVAGMMVG
ncbi:agmatinase [Pseudodesulfovibrio sp.]|nr:agmatinase [Pseudodesulfovibrio sp.]